MIVYTERRGGRVAYVDRAEYEFRPSFDEWGRFVVLLRATTDDELMHVSVLHVPAARGLHSG